MVSRAKQLYNSFFAKKQVSFQTPCVIVGFVKSIKSIKGVYGTNDLVVIDGSFANSQEDFEGNISFFLTASSLKSQFSKLKIKEGDYIQVYYHGIKTSSTGNKFKSFYVKKDKEFSEFVEKAEKNNKENEKEFKKITEEMDKIIEEIFE